MILGGSIEIKQMISNSLQALRFTKQMKKAIIHFDGGANPNPGPSACGYVVQIIPNTTSNEISVLKKIGYGVYLDKGTNNKAEYQGLIHSLRWCLKNEITDCEIYGDSKLVIEQIHGRWKVKEPTLVPYHKEAKELWEQFSLIGTVKCSWVKREKNSQADEMCDLALELKADCLKIFDS